tara:strand:- start:239 stop:478 length:240 start_codon:yes stop_codon:yes gene_type:complete
MKTAWTKGLEEDSISQMKDSFDAGGLLRQRLVTLIRDKMGASEKLGLSKDGYDTPNWDLKKADETGYKRAAQEIINLIS